MYCAILAIGTNINVGTMRQPSRQMDQQKVPGGGRWRDVKQLICETMQQANSKPASKEGRTTENVEHAKV
ncbi:hypothetical protein BCR44DRAFT_1431976 [Catenaria anguillulae PL171]|uniref:Uncharacterized protein n=1 Tax=Catenaria anguillulae PL171 TaxID=765915 RepID=A0A1Y2HT73_9FUNG|nr:hypothetical protein BCR44DRAFT_1431976 [Catenaria anguillulae PL171]